MVKVKAVMPKMKKLKVERVAVRLPKPMLDEIDRIMKRFPEFNYNRQQFVESAVRDKNEKLKYLETVRKE